MVAEPLAGLDLVAYNGSNLQRCRQALRLTELSVEYTYLCRFAGAVQRAIDETSRSHASQER